MTYTIILTTEEGETVDLNVIIKGFEHAVKLARLYKRLYKASAAEIKAL